MAFDVGSILGSVVSSVVKGLVQAFQAWFAARKAEVNESTVTAMRASEKDRKEVIEVENKIEAVGIAAAKAADKDSESVKHEIMLEHLRSVNKTTKT